MYKQNHLHKMGKENQPLQRPKALGKQNFWWATVGILALCLGGLVKALFADLQNSRLDAFLFGSGLFVGLLWFLMKEKPRSCHKSLPKGLLPSMLALVALACLEGGLVWGGIASASPQLAGLIHAAIPVGGLLAAIASMAGIILAKLQDRRWSAVYFLGLTIVMLSVFVLSILHAINLDRSIVSWWVPYAWQGGTILLTGAAATTLSVLRKK